MTNAKKEAEKEKRLIKLRYKKAKWLLYDEILKASKDLEDLNALLYDEILKDKIIDLTLFELFENVLQYKYTTEETQEDLNFYLLENYNTLANKIITIKTKERKEKAKKELEEQQNYIDNLYIEALQEWEKQQKSKFYYKWALYDKNAPYWLNKKQEFINNYIKNHLNK